MKKVCARKLDALKCSPVGLNMPISFVERVNDTEIALVLWRPNSSSFVI